MGTNLSQISDSSLLLWPGTQKSTTHQAALAKCARFARPAWIQLPADLIETRYRLKAVEYSFDESERAIAIQARLRKIFEESNEKSLTFTQFYLIAQPHAGASCYNISDYVKSCVDGDLSVAERLRGRTLIHIYQTEKAVDDLLSDSGVDRFIKRFLTQYLEMYGTEAIIGFTCELPSFLSVLAADGASIPWSPAMLGEIVPETAEVKHKPAENARERLLNQQPATLPLLFHEAYDSAVVRSAYWQALTVQFAECFIGGLRNFCHQHGLKFSVTLQASAKTLTFELGTLLSEIDCPILRTTVLNTPRRLVVAKSVCSHAKHVGMLRNGTSILSQRLSDATLGFNQWVSVSSELYGEPTLTARFAATGHPKRASLMVSPTQSLWMKPSEKQWNHVTKAWGWFCQTVWHLGYDFHIVSEARLIESTVNSEKQGISFNGEVYQLVLLPSCISLHETTVERLTTFTKAKGRLLVNAPVPYLLNGRIGLEPYPLEHLMYRRRTTILDGPLKERETALKKFLRKWVPSVISFYARPANQLTEAIQVHHRQDGNRHTFYLFNTAAKPMDTLVEIAGEAAAVDELQLQTGKQVSIDAWHADGKTYLNCKFAPKQGRLFLVS